MYSELFFSFFSFFFWSTPPRASKVRSFWVFLFFYFSYSDSFVVDHQSSSLHLFFVVCYMRVVSCCGSTIVECSIQHECFIFIVCLYVSIWFIKTFLFYYSIETLLQTQYFYWHALLFGIGTSIIARNITYKMVFGFQLIFSFIDIYIGIIDEEGLFSRKTINSCQEVVGAGKVSLVFYQLLFVISQRHKLCIISKIVIFCLFYEIVVTFEQYLTWLCVFHNIQKWL